MKDIKCNKDGCKGKLNMKDVKFVSALKGAAKCRKCGKNNFVTRVAPNLKIPRSIASYVKLDRVEPK